MEIDEPIEHSKPRFAHQPEYRRHRCAKCGNWYISGKGRLDTGLCESCAKSDGLYVQTRIPTR